jgi:hypothetical protein
LHAYVDFGLNHPDHYQITFMIADQHAADPDRAARRHGVGCQAFDCLRVAVDACMKAGRLRVIDLDLASQVLWAGVHGITSLLIVHPDFPWVNKQALIDGMIGTLLEGLRV